MNTVFSCTVSGHHSLGSDYSRYYDATLTLTSGLQLPAGAQINSVTLNCSNITVWASNLVNQAHIRLDGVDFTSAQWSPRGDNQSITKSCYTTASIYAGKNAFTFFCGWDSSPTGSAWCSFRSGGTLTLTINWDATDDINTYTQDVTAGSSASVTVNDSGYTHTAIWAFGVHSASVSMAAHTTGASFTFPLTWLDVIPNSMTGSGTLTLITTSGQSEIGRVSRTVTFRCPASPPLLSGLSDGATGKFGSYYLAGVTALSPTVQAAAQNYASIASVSFNLPSGVIGSTGTFTLTATVRDSRGQTSTLSGAAFTVKGYDPPVLTVNTCNRCTTAGMDADDGTAVKAKAMATTTEDGYTNPLVSLTFAAKIADDDDFGAEQTLTNGIQSVLTYRMFDTTRTYDVRFTATDTVGKATSVVRRISVTGYKMYLRKDGSGVAFGKACEHSKALEIPADWDFYKGGSPIGMNMDLVYPVGSIYMSVNATDPAVLFGVGTWVRIQDRFLLAAGSSYASGATGGSATHTPSGTVGNHTLTVNEIPAHNHSMTLNIQHSDGEQVPSSEAMQTGLRVGGRRRYRDTTDNKGGGGAHNHGFTGTSQNTMPPYLAVYIWKRTA